MPRLTLVSALVLCVACGSDKTPEPSPVAASVAVSATASVAVPPVQVVKVSGISMEVPEAFVPLEAPKQERLRAAAAAREPNSAVSVDARRAPAGMNGGTAYVMRIDLPEDPAAMRGTVRETLEYTEAALRLEMTLQGSSENQWEATYDNDRLEIFSRVTMSQGPKSVILEMRSVVFMTPANRLATLSAQCMADLATLCEPLLRNAKIEEEPRRALGELLGPPNERWTSIAGFEFGQSRAAFAEACRGAKHKVDQFDWKKEPAEVRAFVDQGVISRCTGTPKPFADGKVVAAGALFQEDKLTGLSLYLEEDVPTMRERIFARYNSGITDPTRGIAFFNLIAKGYEPFLVRVDPVNLPGSTKVRSAAAFASRIAFDTPRPAE